MLGSVNGHCASNPHYLPALHTLVLIHANPELNFRNKGLAQVPRLYEARFDIRVNFDPFCFIDQVSIEVFLSLLQERLFLKTFAGKGPNMAQTL